MGTSLRQFKDRQFTHVQVIYSADVVGSAGDINRMSPASHMPAGYGGDSDNPYYGRPMREKMEAVAAQFTETEGDDQYDYGYLAEETGNTQFLPAADMPEDYEGDGYQGHHRKWVGVLTKAEWLLFAQSYNVDLDYHGYPIDYEDTMGALTEEGLLFAVSVDNSEGWRDFSGPVFVGSSFYVSFATEKE